MSENTRNPARWHCSCPEPADGHRFKMDGRMRRCLSCGILWMPMPAFWAPISPPKDFFTVPLASILNQEGTPSGGPLPEGLHGPVRAGPSQLERFVADKLAEAEKRNMDAIGEVLFEDNPYGGDE